MTNNLNPNDLPVMQILWESGPLKPAQIQERLAAPIKNAALRWQLRTLMEKGHVRRRKSGRAYYYEARTPRDGTFRKLAGRLADVFCGGSTAALIAHLMRTEKLSQEDIRELQLIANEKLQGPEYIKKTTER